MFSDLGSFIGGYESTVVLMVQTLRLEELQL